MISHTLTDVQKQVADEVCLFFVLLEVNLVGFSKHFPVNIAKVIAGGIFAMLSELDRKTMKGTAMQSSDIAFDDPSGTEFQPLEPGRHSAV